MINRAIHNRNKFRLDYDACAWGVTTLAKNANLSETEVLRRLQTYLENGVMYADKNADGKTLRYKFPFIPDEYREQILYADNMGLLDEDGTEWTI
jgi:hypothetical protein